MEACYVKAGGRLCLCLWVSKFTKIVDSSIFLFYADCWCAY